MAKIIVVTSGKGGVGKTTTTAKLAARCVVRYGADRLALLTTDGDAEPCTVMPPSNSISCARE